MKKFLPAFLAIGAMAAAPAAMADGWYADGGYTFLSADGGGIDVDLGALTARGGYDFTENFGAEIEGSFGVADETVAGATVELNYLVGAYGKVQMPVSETVNLFARVGVVQGELEASSGGTTISGSETGVGYGVGATYSFNQNMYVRGDYTRHDIDEVEADAFAVAIGMKF